MDSYETATFGAGCFWCVEAVFQDLSGVHSVTSGYSGGEPFRPTYEEVCCGNAGHAEVVRIVYDPAAISFDDLLYIFWRVHDPTSLNRQGKDVGSQYRSAIFYHHAEQRRRSEKSRSETAHSGLWPNPIVTDIAPLEHFYEAEGYHQDFYRMHPDAPYCRFVIHPKMEKLKWAFGDRLRGMT